MRRFSLVSVAALPALAWFALAQTPTTQPQPPLPVAVVARLPACTVEQMQVSINGKANGEAGGGDGRSHGGALIILRNHGAAACRLMPLARATLLDRDGRPLGPFATTVPGARGMHPGPVVLPIAVAAGAEVTASLRWISGPVSASSLCLDPSTLVLALGELTLKTSLTGRLCGDRTDGVRAELSRFVPDPIVVAPGRQ